MSNDKNLIPLNQRSKSVQREIQSKGGNAARESKRKRKALKESMEILLNSPITDKRQFNTAVKMGFDMEDLDKSVLVVIALYKKAISGDVPAIKELRSLIEESGNDTGQLETLLRGILDADIQPETD